MRRRARIRRKSTAELARTEALTRRPTPETRLGLQRLLPPALALSACASSPGAAPDPTLRSLAALDTFREETDGFRETEL